MENASELRNLGREREGMRREGINGREGSREAREGREEERERGQRKGGE